jgi:hypothetical protein
MGWLHQNLTANGGAGSPSSFGRVVVAKAIFDFITSDCVGDIVVNDGGDNYVVGETFDIDIPLSPGSIIETFKAKGVVVSTGINSPTSSPGSSAVRVKVYSGGAYTNLVQSPELTLTGIPTSNASLSGTGLTVDITPEAAHWFERRGAGAQSPVSGTDYVDTATDFEWICTSYKATNPPTVGMESNVSGGNDYLDLMTATGFDKTQTLFSQPDTHSSTANLMTPSTDPELYVSSTERRVCIMIRDGNFVQYGIIGLFIPFTNTEANYPFPGITAGQSPGVRNFTETYTDGNGSVPTSQNAGVVHPMTLQTGTATSSPYWIRDNVSPTWKSLSRTVSGVSMPCAIWPNVSGDHIFGFTDAPVVDGHSTNPESYIAGIFGDDEGNEDGWFQTENLATGRGAPGIGLLGLNNRLSLVVTPHIIQGLTGDVQVLGILDGFEAVHGIGLTAFEEIVQFQGKRYIVFPDTNSGTLYRWVAMEIV